jgi:hypothetical protein
MLCGVSVVFNSLGDVLGLVSCKRSSENGQVLVGFQSTKPLAASIMPAAVQRNAIAAFRHRFTLRQTWRTVPIMFSIELVQASERLRLCRQAEAVDGEHLVESFEDAGGNTGRLLVKPTGEIPQQPLGFIGILEFPSLPERPAYRDMPGGPAWTGQTPSTRPAVLPTVPRTGAESIVGASGQNESRARRERGQNEPH